VDTFESVRFEAARVHEEASAAGADPSRPLELVEMAIAIREIELAWLAPGDPYLRGGRGLYDPHVDAIACENRGDPAARALLAGHELGHAVLHDPGEAIVDRDIDPARATEGAATGIEKVEDYGRRERREVQADLFARELVLPRPRARMLFMDEGRSAAAIAAETGLPYALVAQQLSDALLLPAYAPRVASATGARPPLDDSQRAAAFHEGSPYLLQAGPGTGKTRTLISRIERLLDADVPASEILVLTFSNKATGELVERLTSSRPEAAAAAWIGTFHGFGLDVLRQFHDRDGLSDNPRLVDKADAVGMLEELVPRLPLRHYRNLHDPTLDLSDILSAISRAKDELTTPERYRELAERMAEVAVDVESEVRAQKAIEVAEVYRIYDEAMRRAGRLDFGDLVMRPAFLLERDAEAREILRGKHRHILVDEYQDVNRASVRLLRALAGGGERLWVVGDSRQSIYRFRGASSANMAGFGRDFPGAEFGRLTVNYRSSSEVVRTFTEFATGMLASRAALPLDLEAHAGVSGDMPEIRRVVRPEDEAAAVAARVIEMRDVHGIAFCEQAVLCRGNTGLAVVAAELERRDVPVLFLGNLFERDEIRDLLALLALLVDPKAGTLARIASMPRYAITLDEIGRIHALIAGCETPLAWLADAIAAVGGAAAKALKSIADDLDGLNRASHPWDALCRILLDRRSPMLDLCASSTVRDRMRRVAVWQFMAFCRDLPPGKGLPIQRLLDRARRLVLLSEERDLRQMPAAATTMDGVHLMTVHGSKGLEFEAVHVPGMVVRGFPGDNRTPRCPPPDGLIAGSEGLSGIEALKLGHGEEEECLFFVAMSRAKRSLTLYAVGQMANGNNRSPSPYLAKIAGRTIDMRQPPLHRPAPAETGWHRVDVEWLGVPTFTAEQLALYDKCPRRFFYTHVLGVAGGRRSTAFVRMHDVVYEVLRWLRQDVGRWVSPPDQVEAWFDEIWTAKGPTDEGYADDYRRIGLGLVEALMRSRQGHAPGPRDAVQIDLNGLAVLVAPDEVRDARGTVMFRRVRTGRKSATEEDQLAYALYLLAARQRYGPAAGVEAIHLSEDLVTPISLTPRKVANREVKVREIAARILSGDFPPDHNDRTCPRCPHYVSCGPMPVGRLLFKTAR